MNFEIIEKRVIRYFIKIDDKEFLFSDYVEIIEMLENTDGYFNTIIVNDDDLADALIRHEIASKNTNGSFRRGPNYEKAREKIANFL